MENMRHDDGENDGVYRKFIIVLYHAHTKKGAEFL